MAFHSSQTSVYEFYEQLTPWAKIAAVGAIITSLYLPYKYLVTRKRKTPIKDDYEQGHLPVSKFINTDLISFV